LTIRNVVWITNGDLKFEMVSNGQKIQNLMDHLENQKKIPFSNTRLVRSPMAQ
jgi:hypothetical protein